MVFFLCGGWGARLRWSLLGADRGGLLALRDLEPGCKSLLARKKTTDFVHGLFFVRRMGLEPTRNCLHKILSLARLPVPTPPQARFFQRK